MKRARPAGAGPLQPHTEWRVPPIRRARELPVPGQGLWYSAGDPTKRVCMRLRADPIRWYCLCAMMGGGVGRMSALEDEVTRIAIREIEPIVQRIVEPLRVAIVKVQGDVATLKGDVAGLRTEMGAMEARLLAAINGARG